jgi:hypothetical protein
MKQVVQGDEQKTWKDTPSLEEFSPAATTARRKIVAAWTLWRSTDAKVRAVRGRNLEILSWDRYFIFGRVLDNSSFICPTYEFQTCLFDLNET